MKTPYRYEETNFDREPQLSRDEIERRSKRREELEERIPKVAETLLDLLDEYDCSRSDELINSISLSVRDIAYLDRFHELWFALVCFVRLVKDDKPTPQTWISKPIGPGEIGEKLHRHYYPKRDYYAELVRREEGSER